MKRIGNAARRHFVSPYFDLLLMQPIVHRCIAIPCIFSVCIQGDLIVRSSSRPQTTVWDIKMISFLQKKFTEIPNFYSIVLDFFLTPSAYFFIYRYVIFLKLHKNIFLLKFASVVVKTLASLACNPSYMFVFRRIFAAYIQGDSIIRSSSITNITRIPFGI